MPTFPLDPNAPSPALTVHDLPMGGCARAADHEAHLAAGDPRCENERVGGLTPTLRKRIERGAAWLDSVRPDWRGRIDLDALNLVSGDHCVLGQVYADEVEDPDNSDGFDYATTYVIPRTDNSKRDDWLVAHGFDEYLTSSPYGGIFDYDPLTEGWRRYLSEQR